MNQQDALFSVLVPLYLPRQKLEVLGFLALGDRLNSRGYSWEEQSALKDLGQQAGIALYVAQLRQHRVATLEEVATFNSDDIARSKDSRL